MKEYYIGKNGLRKDLDWKELIQEAKDYGYDSDSSIYTTSGAAGWLRKGGYTVGENKKYRREV